MIRVLIADEHAAVRSGLKLLLGTTPDMVIAAEATHGSEVLAKLRVEPIDLLILEMTMQGVNVAALIRRIREEWPMLPVLVLSVRHEAAIVSQALRAGASGYATKKSDIDMLLLAIRKVANGGRFIDPTLVELMVFEAPPDDSPLYKILSDREFQVLQMLADGKSNNEVAATLILSPKTISTHKTRLMRKLGLASDADLIRYAIRQCLVTTA